MGHPSLHEVELVEAVELARSLDVQLDQARADLKAAERERDAAIAAVKRLTAKRDADEGAVA